MGILDDLGRALSAKTDQKTPVQKNPSISGGLGVVSSVNADGTINVTFNGATVPCFATNSFIPAVGQSVVLFIVGSQVFALGSGTQSGATISALWGAAINAEFSYPGNPNGNVTAQEAGDVCIDTVTPAIWQAPGPGSLWDPVSAFNISGGIGSAVLAGSGSFAAGVNAVAEGQDTLASGEASHAEGGTTTASNTSAHAEGGTTTASGTFSHAEGSSTTASGSAAHAEGNGSIASGGTSHVEGWETSATAFTAHAEGYGATAYMGGQHAHSSSGPGGGQFSRVTAAVITTNATATPLNGGDFAGTTALLNSSFNMAAGLTFRLVARHSGGGTVGSWIATGAVDGNGTSAYRWVGGSAPTFSSVVADSGASSWSAAITLGGSGNSHIFVTVTGVSATTIHWTVTIELDEVI